MFKTKDSGERKEFETGMQRDTNKGKPRYDLIIPLLSKSPMLERWAHLLARGADKYTERNWEKAETKEELARFKESAFRHFMQWFMNDEEEDHGAAVMFNIQGAEYVKERLSNKVNKNVGHKTKAGQHKVNEGGLQRGICEAGAKNVGEVPERVTGVRKSPRVSKKTT